MNSTHISMHFIHLNQKDTAAETCLEHRPVADGMGFSLVPGRPVIEQRLGQRIAATVRGGDLSWEIGRQPGPPVA